MGKLCGGGFQERGALSNFREDDFAKLFSVYRDRVAIRTFISQLKSLWNCPQAPPPTFSSHAFPFMQQSHPNQQNPPPENLMHPVQHRARICDWCHNN